MNQNHVDDGREVPVSVEKSDDGDSPATPGDEEAPALEPDAEAPPPRETTPIEELKRDLQEARDQHLRLRAEFDNFRKRTAREQRQIRERANEHVIKDLLPVIDGLERAGESIAMENENGPALKEGIDLVLKSLVESLGRHDLQRLEALAQPFDPKLHEAVMTVETEDHPPDTVIEEIQKGYAIGDRVIRPSRVVVAKALPEEED